MNRSTLAALPLILGLATTVSLETLQQQRDAEAMADAASNFLTSLSRPQRSLATFAVDSDERSRHHFIPPEAFERHGMVYKDMSSEQKVRALDMLRSGLSQKGYLTAQQIMEVEGILGVLVEGEDRELARDQEEYWVSVFGTPSTDGTWGWRWEGHPASVPTGPRRGLRALREQEDTARALLASLDANQQDAAISHCTSRSWKETSPSARRPSWVRIRRPSPPVRGEDYEH